MNVELITTPFHNHLSWTRLSVLDPKMKTKTMIDRDIETSVLMEGTQDQRSRHFTRRTCFIGQPRKFEIFPNS